jgi:hypothetical protein
VNKADLDYAVGDFIPSRDSNVFEFMELLAVFECSSRSLLPEKYKNLTGEQISNRLRELKLLANL